MATNTTDFWSQRGLTDEVIRTQGSLHPSRSVELSAAQPPLDSPPAGVQPARAADSGEAAEPAQELALAPLVDQLAYGFARVLLVAMKELEGYIANENRKLGDNVAERLGTLQASFHELTAVVSDQRSAAGALQERCDRLESLTASLNEADAGLEKQISVLRSEAAAEAASITARIDSTVAALQDSGAQQQAEVAGVRTEVKELITSVQEKLVTETAELRACDERQESELVALRNEATTASTAVTSRIAELHNEVMVQQEDIVAIKSTLSGINVRVDGVMERLDKQAEAVHSMYSTYAQRESELEQVIEGLTRLRSVPTPAPAIRL